MLLPAGRRVVLVFAALLLVAVAVLALSESASDSRPPSASVSRERPSATAVRDTSLDDAGAAGFLGVILPYEAVDVSARLDGQIVEVRARVGERVRRGDIVALVNSATVTAADLTMAEADLRAAEAEARRLAIELEQSRERLGRTKALNKKGLVTAEYVSDVSYQEQLAAARVNAADATIAQRRAAVEQRKARLENTEVRAPFDGTVAVRYLERGTMVGVGSPVIRLVHTSPLKVRFAVAGAQSHTVRVGDRLVATVDELHARFPGEVDAVAPEIDSASQMLVVEGVLDATAAEQAVLSQAVAGRVASVRLEVRRDAVPAVRREQDERRRR